MLPLPRLRIFCRGYAVSVKPPVVYPKKKGERIYSVKKSFRYNQYTNLLRTASHSPLIFLTHTDFTAQRLIKLRREIATAFSRIPNTTPSLPPPTLTVLRTAIFGVALRDFSTVDIAESIQLADLVKGPLAVLTLPSLHPPQLSGFLRSLDRAVPPKKPKTPEQLAQELADKNADPVTPGRRIKRQRPVLTPELKLVGALIEGRFFGHPRLHEVARLPTLDTLRAQIVGLLGSPAVQLAGVLSEAGGGKLARTLQGLKKGLEEGQSDTAI